eukprot:TRINITY_DN65686_c0_g1_i1.p1 TRINITY_DN65686_c0_g1~~TRINITY_DN65686_c0_g1_i1.p1  ORF type:complete len:721 (+),score=123.45 TRINITY_DN65686_c0_g1_i1:99-2165(+)
MPPPPRPSSSLRSLLLGTFAVVSLPLVWLHGRHSALPEQAAVPVVRDKEKVIEGEDDTGTSILKAQVTALSRQLQQLRVQSKQVWMEPMTVTLYSKPMCGGASITFGPSHHQAKCKSCLDACGSKFDSGLDMHQVQGGSMVKSLRVSGPGVLRLHENCLGTFDYTGAVLQGGYSRKDGCVNLHEAFGHFRIEIDETVLPGGSLDSLRRSVSALDAQMGGKTEAKAVSVATGGGGGAEAATSGLGAFGTDDGPASRYQGRDWLEPLRKGSVHQKWKQRFKTKVFLSGERLASCGNAEADAANAKGVELVRAHVEMWNIPEEVRDPSVAEPHFKRAIELAPDCVTPRINMAVVLLDRLEPAELPQGRAYLMPQGKCLDHPKALLICGAYYELEAYDNSDNHRRADWASATGNYIAAFEKDNELPLQYFGRPHKSWGTRSVPPEPRMFYDPNDATQGNFKAHELQRRCVRRLLMYGEFASHFGGYGSVTKAEADNFLDIWSIHLRRLVPPYPIMVLQQAYRPMVRNKWLRWSYAPHPEWPEARWTHHNGPAARFLQAAILPRIESLTNTLLHPTYTYFGSYVSGAAILPHIDREQCEYTLSITIDAHPLTAVCPFGVSSEPNRIKKTGYTDDPFNKNLVPPKGKRIMIDSYISDGALIRGRGVIHWRPKSEHNCTQFFFHFVRREFTGDLN